jgi:2,4-dienoyl-CoA reductase (NADPH2)
MSSAFQHLLSPLRIGPKTLRNRVLVTAHVPGLAENHLPSERWIAYHRARTRGGAGLQITGATPVHRSGPLESPLCIQNYDDAIIPGYRKLAAAIHEEGGTFLAQLAHSAQTGSSSDVGRPLWAPSPVPSDLVQQIPHAMTEAEIAEVVAAFGAAACRVREGHLDGVEILGAFGYLLAAFMSPKMNQRTDRYGGSLDNRLRFSLEVVDAVRDAVGPDRIVGMRIPGDEQTEGGLTLADMTAIAKRLAATGKLDYLNVIAGSNSDRLMRWEHWPPTPAPHGLFVHLAAAIKAVVPIHRLQWAGHGRGPRRRRAGHRP